MIDVFVAILFGLFGYFARRHGYPLISLVIGLILGKLAEGWFHQALQISDHDYSVFVLRPLSASIFAICVVIVILPGVKKRIGGAAPKTRRLLRVRESKPETEIKKFLDASCRASARRIC